MTHIIHVSDLHFGRKRDDATETGYLLLEQIYEQYQFEQASDTYLLATGDFVDGKDADDFDRQWQDAAQAFAKFKGKLLVCAGNHDLGWWGSIEKYREFCKDLSISGACSVRTRLENDSTCIDLLGVDSTFWCPGLGIAGVGRIDDGEMRAVEEFARAPAAGWKLLYMHHRPIEPSLSDEANQSIANGSMKEPVALDLRKPFLGLVGAERLLTTIADKVDLLAFGHDKDFMTDVTSHGKPVWVNCNREDTRTGGWVALEFTPTRCAITVHDDLGRRRAQHTIEKSA